MTARPRVGSCACSRQTHTCASAGDGLPDVAIAHDFLTQRGGAERVVLAMSRVFPEATIYTTLFDPDRTYPEFAEKRIVVSPLDRVPLLRHNPRLALPLLPPASRLIRPRARVVLTSSSGFAHGFGGCGRRLVYCHAPARWLYQSDLYLGESGRWDIARIGLKALRPALRRWDRRSAARADRYLVNSRVVRERVRAAYGIEADVLAPPVTMDASDTQTAVADLADWADGYHLVVSRLLPYKNVEAAVAAFAGMPQRRLVVVGVGPEATALVRTLPPNVRIVRDLDDAELRWTYAHCLVLLAPSYEDFGLTPLEAGVFGKPTLALESGGYLDTVVEGRTGLFFPRPTPEAIAAAVAKADETAWSPEDIRAHAAEFGPERFAAGLRAEVQRLLAVDKPADAEVGQ